MGRRSTTRALVVWMNGERVGTWIAKDRAEHRFEYADSWLESPRRRPISLSMPMRPPSEPYRGDRVLAWFDNLLPDSNHIRRRMMARFAVFSDAPFDLLAEVGRDCVGAVQLLPPGMEPGDILRIEGVPLTEADLEQVLLAARGGLALQQDDEDFRISLAGTQEKTALLHHQGRWMRPLGTTPTTHILKLPIEDTTPGGIDLSTSVENEWLCARILGAYGFEVARCEIATFGSQKALVVERFDRAAAPDGSWIIRLPQEDFCQIYGIPQDRKYESVGGPGIREIMDTLSGSSRALEDRRRFMGAQFIFWLLCAIDGHAKNFSVFLEPGGTFRLTPLYDVLSAHAFPGQGARRIPPQKAKMAMAVSGRNRHDHWREIRLEHFIQTARACGLPDGGEDIYESILARTDEVAAKVASELPADFPREVSEPILQGLVDTARHARAGTAPGPAT